MPPQYILTLLDIWRDNLQAEWSICTTLWEALGWDTLQLAVFYWFADLVGCVLVPVAIGWSAPWLASSSLRELSLEGLDSLPGTWGNPFLGECWRGPRYFCEYRACLGYSPAPGPTLKRPCAILIWLVGHKTNTDNLQAARQYQKDIPNSCTTPLCRTLLEKQRRDHKWCAPVDPRIWPIKSRTTSSNIHTTAMWWYGM